MTVSELLRTGTEKLKSVGIDDAEFDARCLAEYVLNFDSFYLRLNSYVKVGEADAETYFDLLNRRINGEPLQYILGEWSFMGFDFKVGRGVLIPRDDTEVVVNLCIDFLKNRTDKKTVDLCSGSGAIAVALDKISGAEVTAVEIDETAFSYLETNVKENNSSVKPVMADALKICDTFADGELDLIVSNPPTSKHFKKKFSLNQDLHLTAARTAAIFTVK